jgi:hypothetical protein
MKSNKIAIFATRQTEVQLNMDEYVRMGPRGFMPISVL